MNLKAWKIAMELVKEIYQVTKDYPREEMYGLTSQTRRAAVSIPANIAEGVGRKHSNDTLHFLHISRGSAYELETLLCIAIRIGILKEEVFERVLLKMEEMIMVLNGLIKYFLGRVQEHKP